MRKNVIALLVAAYEIIDSQPDAVDLDRAYVPCVLTEQLRAQEPTRQEIQAAASQCCTGVFNQLAFIGFFSTLVKADHWSDIFGQVEHSIKQGVRRLIG